MKLYRLTMLKKFIMILVTFVLVVAMTACATPTQQNKESMTIKPCEFSEETLSVLKLVDEDILFFDFIVDDTVKSYTIDALVYEDGAWKDYGSTSGNIGTSNNRIAINVKETGYSIKTGDKGGFIGYSSDAIYSKLDNTKQQASYKLTNPTTIITDTEITLWCKIGNMGNGLSVNKDFRNADCTAGMAFTIKFSDKVLP